MRTTATSSRARRSCARGSPRPAAGSPRSRAACRSRRHRPQPPHVPLEDARRGADRLRRLGARPERVRRLRRARRLEAAPATDVLVSSSPRAAGTRSRCSIRTAIRPTASSARARVQARRRPDRCSPTPDLHWHPSLKPLARLHDQRQAHRLPGDRLHAPRTSRTSPRATTGRSARSTRTSAPAGSGGSSTWSATTRTRCRASRSTRRCCPRSRPRRCPSRRSTTRRLRLRLPATSGTSRARCCPMRSARSAASTTRPTRS